MAELEGDTVVLEGDIVVILSSELISKITEEYFNKTMFKQRVTIVDLKPTPDGYAFNVAFVKKEVTVPQAVNSLFKEQTKAALEAQDEEYGRYMAAASNVTIPARDNNGRFTKSEVK